METTDTIAAEISASAIPTVLFLGAGASMPSGAPSGGMLADELTREFFPGERQRSLSDIAGRIEFKFGRQSLVKILRDKIVPLKPSPSIRYLPTFNFSSIFTTNYDQIIEKAYKELGIDLPVIRSNKDYAFDYRQYNTMLYKLHGCITEDRADGLSHGMIVTDEDYSTYQKFRKIGFDAFGNALNTSNVVFVGYSMADDNIKEYVESSIAQASRQQGPGQVFLILYERDEIEALRWEARGLRVAFGDLDALLASLATVKQRLAKVNIFSPISSYPQHVIAAEISSVKPSDERAKTANLMKLVSGSEVTYADVAAGYAFARSTSREIYQQIDTSNSANIHILLGPSGSGKTSAARLAMAELDTRGIVCYEHKSNIPVDLPTWIDIDKEHLTAGQRACLFLDEPSASQLAVNLLAQHLADGQDHALSLIITYHPSIWLYRTKSPALTKKSIVHDLRQLSPADINAIAIHVKRIPELAELLATDIRAKTHAEIVETVRRRAKSDLFVSLKYLFETKSLDEIVLREYAKIGDAQPSEMKTNLQELYAAVAFLQACGRYVHRLMVMRIVEVRADEIGEMLTLLDGVVIEEGRDDHIEGVYEWTTRHPRIAEIIAASKFSRRKRKELLEEVILSINPASRVERQFCGQLCNTEMGIESLRPEDQTDLYRMLSDALPGERIPRHRLIRNLIRQKEFGEAELAIAEAREMKINDSVIHRYDVLLNVARAEHLDFLERVDRLNLLETAVSKADKSLSRRPDDMYNYESLCNAAFALALQGGDIAIFEDAVEKLKKSYDTIGDDLIISWIGKFESELIRLKGSRGLGTAH